MQMKSDLLTRFSLFKDLPEGAVEAIVRHSCILDFSDQEFICREGDIVNNIYIITRGAANVIKSFGAPDEHNLAQVTAGDIIGEINLYEPDQVRSASVVAVGEVSALQISIAEMEAQVREYPQIAVRLFREISQRLRDTESRLVQHLSARNQALQKALTELQAAQEQIIAKEKMDYELSMARGIQENLLPKQIPTIPGWQITVSWEPAHSVSGDFYDFIPFPDGRLGLIIGDVTGKGIPAALVMATSHSVLRAVTGGVRETRYNPPGEILARVNNLLSQNMPKFMFVTCLLAIIDLLEGDIAIANAGHVFPIHISAHTLNEVKAKGMPLGLIPDQDYQSTTTRIQPNESLFFMSDGLIEAHDRDGTMYGTRRVNEQLRNLYKGATSDIHALIPGVLKDLHEFTGESWEQEDDLTLLTLSRE